MQQNSATPTAITKIAFDGMVERRGKGCFLCVGGWGHQNKFPKTKPKTLLEQKSSNSWPPLSLTHSTMPSSRHSLKSSQKRIVRLPPSYSYHSINSTWINILWFTQKPIKKKGNLTFVYLSIKTLQDNHQLDIVFQRLTPISNQVTKHTVFIHALKLTMQDHQLYLIFQRRP